jgi:hypothetical protein
MDSRRQTCLLPSQAWGSTVSGMKKSAARAAIDIAFIIFLFYANLLMGEFERSGTGQRRGLGWALADIFTSSNFGIAVAAAIVGYIVFEFLRTRC